MNRLTEYIVACTNLYGMVHKEMVVEIYNAQCGAELPPMDIQSLQCGNISVETEELARNMTEIVGDWFVAAPIAEFGEVEYYLDLKRDKPYYVPEQEELLKYTDDWYFERNLQFVELVEYMRDMFFEGEEDVAEELAAEVQGICQYGFDITEIMREIARHGVVFADAEAVNEFMPFVMELMNNTRLWENNGHTPMELFTEEELDFDDIEVSLEPVETKKPMYVYRRNHDREKGLFDFSKRRIFNMSDEEKEVLEVCYRLLPLPSNVPVQELDFLLERRELAIPFLIHGLERALEMVDEVAEKDYMFPIFAMYLLGEMEAKEAGDVLLKYTRLDMESLDIILDDMLYERYPAVLYHCLEDMEPLKDMICDQGIDVQMRSILLDVYVAHVLYRLDQRGEAVVYMRDLGNNDALLKEGGEAFVTEWVALVEDFKLYELVPMVKDFYERKHMDLNMYGQFDEYVDMMYYPKSAGIFMKGEKIHAVDELGEWGCFASEDASSKALVAEARKELEEYEEQVRINDLIMSGKVGRNEPCPCGSGVKFKFCHMKKKKYAEDDMSFIEEERKEWLQDYPRTDGVRIADEPLITDDFDMEAIEIDQLVYLALHKRRQLPYEMPSEEEIARRRRIYLGKARELFEAKMKREGIRDYDEYDDKYMIHYRCHDWIT